MVSRFSEAGPMVQTIFVLFGGKLMGILPGRIAPCFLGRFGAAQFCQKEEGTWAAPVSRAQRIAIEYAWTT